MLELWFVIIKNMGDNFKKSQEIDYSDVQKETDVTSTDKTECWVISGFLESHYTHCTEYYVSTGCSFKFKSASIWLIVHVIKLNICTKNLTHKWLKSVFNLSSIYTRIIKKHSKNAIYVHDCYSNYEKFQEKCTKIDQCFRKYVSHKY